MTREKMVQKIADALLKEHQFLKKNGIIKNDHEFHSLLYSEAALKACEENMIPKCTNLINPTDDGCSCDSLYGELCKNNWELELDVETLLRAKEWIDKNKRTSD